MATREPVSFAAEATRPRRYIGVEGMPTTIPAAFTTLRSHLNITGLQSETVSARQQGLLDLVASELTVLDSFLTGSCSRSTLIAPLDEADIDVVVVLDAEYHPSGARNVLERTRSALLKTYDTPKISRNGQAVTILFTDFAVDVVPAFYRKGGGYLLCDSGSNRYISTDPKRHIEISAGHNRDHGGDLVPVVKMIKAWNRNIDWHFRSFHLEVLAWKVFTKVNQNNDWSAVGFFFDKARATMPHKLPDPAGYGGDVSDYIGSELQIAAAVSRLDTALGRARRAEEHAQSGRVVAAFDEWRKIFGSYFPAYG